MAIARGDWHDRAFYARLLAGDRRCFAWEWLRRTPAYNEAWLAGAAPEAFGLVRLEDPIRDALAARPMWTASVDRGVLRADGCAAEGGDRLEFVRLMPFATIISAGKARWCILLSDGLRSVRVDLCASAPLSRPMILTWHIPGVYDVGTRLTALAQFTALARLGRFSRSLHPRERRSRRWIAMLRVHDALASGATNREIVAELFGVTTAGPHWRLAAASWRLRAQRLASGARACLAMGPGEWLGNKPA